MPVVDEHTPGQSGWLAARVRHPWLSGVLAVLATLVIGDVVVSWTLGTPARLWGVVPLSQMRLASFVALAIALVCACWLSARGWPRTRRARTFLFAAFTLALFMGNGHYIGSHDIAATRVLPFVLGREGRLSFEHTHQTLLTRDDYALTPAGPHLVSRYPVASALLALPAYLPAIIGSYDPRRERVQELERIAAAGLSLVGVLVIFGIALRWLGERQAWFVAGIYAFGTNCASVLSKALWQHTGGAFGFALALAGMFLANSAWSSSLLVGGGLGVAVAARPTNVVPASFVMLAFAAMRGTRPCLRACAWAAAPIAGQLGYAFYYFGSIFGSGYGSEAIDGWSSPWLEGIAGLIVSPGRGLLLYSPCLAFAALALFEPESTGIDRRVSRFLGLAVVSLAVMMGKWWCWWGGGSPGERMTSDITPLWGLGLVLAYRRFACRPRLRQLFIASCAYACACHALITFGRPTAFVTSEFVHVLDGPWSPRAFAPIAYVIGAISSSN